MAFGRRHKSDPPSSASKLERRVASLPSGEIIPWAEQCLVSGGKALIDYGRDNEPYHLDEAMLASNALYACVNELRRRRRDWAGS